MFSNVSVGCRSDAECDSNKACINTECVNPCLLDQSCGKNAECLATNHRAICECRQGFRGDPYNACYIIGCRSDSECPSDKACINSDCQHPCIVSNPCAPVNAECFNQNHQAVCRCRPGFIGNPFFSCTPEPMPECIVDSDCPSQLACIDEQCQNPCTVIQPCQAPAECRVIDTAPVRTMICRCPDGYVGGNDGQCRPVEPLKALGCTADIQCPSDKACFNGICRNPCQCGKF